MSVPTPIKHTLAILEHLYAEIPPLVPAKVREEMAETIRRLRQGVAITRHELEDIIIAFGKKIWSYRRAFAELYDRYQHELGESVLLPHLSPPLRRRYRDFLAYGGSFSDLISGRPATFFTPEERQELAEAFVEVVTHLTAHTSQAAQSVDEKRYQEKIRAFQHLLDDMEHKLHTLRKMAEDEREHPALAAEIRAAIRSFEYGLCLLGPAVTYDAVCQAPEHFAGRKKEKEMLHHLS